MLGAQLRGSRAAVKRSCTSQWPAQVMIFTPVCAAMFCARYSSGSMITASVPSDSMTLRALPEVQQMSDSAFTAADVLTYVTTGTPG